MSELRDERSVPSCGCPDDCIHGHKRKVAAEPAPLRCPHPAGTWLTANRECYVCRCEAERNRFRRALLAIYPLTVEGVAPEVMRIHAARQIREALDG